jgi:hypothetical protein
VRCHGVQERSGEDVGQPVLVAAGRPPTADSELGEQLRPVRAQQASAASAVPAPRRRAPWSSRWVPKAVMPISRSASLSAGPARPRDTLQVGALIAITTATQKLEILYRGGTAQGHWNDMVILKIKVAATCHHFPPSRSKTARRALRGIGSRLPRVRGVRPSSTFRSMWARSRRCAERLCRSLINANTSRSPYWPDSQ